MRIIALLLLLLVIHVCGLDAIVWALNTADDTLRDAYQTIEPQLRKPRHHEAPLGRR